MRLKYLTLLPVLALVTVLLLIPLPVDQIARRWPALLAELENAAHPLVFAWLAWLGFNSLKKRFPQWGWRNYVLSFAITVSFGLTTEVVQAMVGRDSAWIDLRNDALGAAFALLLIARRESLRSRTGGLAPEAWTGIAVLTALLAMAPLGFTLAAYAYRMMQMPILWQAQSTLLNRFSVWQVGRYEGLELQETFSDWRAYSALEVDVRNLDSDPLSISVRVHDRTHNHQYRDRYNGKFEVKAAAATTLRISLDRIRNAPANRQMDMAAIRVVVVFRDTSRQSSRFSVQEVRLTR